MQIYKNHIVLNKKLNLKKKSAGIPTLYDKLIKCVK